MKRKISSFARMAKTLRVSDVLIVLRVRGGFVKLARLKKRRRKAK